MYIFLIILILVVIGYIAGYYAGNEQTEFYKRIEGQIYYLTNDKKDHLITPKKIDRLERIIDEIRRLAKILPRTEYKAGDMPE